jgi:hypothetical protein
MLIPFGVLSAAGAEVGIVSDYELIESVFLTSNQSSITFSNLGTYSSTYKHLQIRAVARNSSDDQFFSVRLNADTGSNYAWHQLGGTGSTVFSGAGTSAVWMVSGQTPQTGDGSLFSATVIDLLDTYSSSKNTTIRTLTGYSGSTPRIILRSGVWINTASVTSATLIVNSGNFVSGSRFSIYGIKG